MEFKYKLLSLTMASILLAACSGDDGKTGADGNTGPEGPRGQQGEPGNDGNNGTDGNNGLTSLITQSTLYSGNTNCFNGGIQFDSGIDANGNDTLDAAEITSTSHVCNTTELNTDKNFSRVASFAVCTQLDPTCDTDEETAAEIAAVSSDGMTLLYSDSPQGALGFVDITTPSAPVAAGVLDLAGEPTSVTVKGDYALVAVNTSNGDFVNTSGVLNVINIANQTSVAQLPLGGQPDSIAVSPDGNYAAVVIENERNELLCVSGTFAGTAYTDEDEAEEQCEDMGNGELGLPPQAPAGELVIVDISNADPTAWTTSRVDLTGTSALFPNDPEPEYVDINANNIAVVTLQENNHIVLVDLTDGSMINEFTAGSVNLTNIDTEGEDPAIINPVGSQDNVLREPDGVSWINNEYFATADEGDLSGGSRGFTVFNTAGDVVWNSGNTLDIMAIRFGHYPDDRSGKKGNEPENIEMGIYGDNRYLFVNSERSSLVFVYDVADPTHPVFKQVLPAGVGPEGGLAIPSRNLLVVASEKDDRGDKIRSVLNIYNYNIQASTYPTVQSANRENGTPIPWSAMSGLSSDPAQDNILYAVEDSFFASNRIFSIDTSTTPATLFAETRIMDSNDIFAAVPTSGATPSVASFDDADLAAMINADKSVNLDPEGIAKAADGGFWIASEGAGTINDTESRPIEKLNFLFKTDENGVIEEVVTLPAEVNNIQIRFGFEGVAVHNTNVYVAFQRAWVGEDNPRIGIYNTVSKTWNFVYYPLDARESQDGGWVGLSDITSLGNGQFLVLERDNKGGPDAAIKRLYKVDLNSVTEGSTITKTLVRNIMADLTAPGSLAFEKVEGSAIMANGDIYIINDNDGVDDNSGETQLINLGNLLNIVRTSTISLEKIGVYATGEFDESAAEIVNFDPATEQAFVVNANSGMIDVLDMSSPNNPTLARSLDLATNIAAAIDGVDADDLGAANSVSVHGDVIAVAVEADIKQNNGYVAFYQTNGTFLSAVTAGALPDMLTFTPNGTKVLVANEGEPNGDYSNDPQGTVTIIDVSGGAAGVTQGDVTTVDFTAFNTGQARADELSDTVRISSKSASVAQDLEPEYITVAADSSKAWVALQENNALAVIDLSDDSVEAILGLGYKNHAILGNELDASNRDDAINIRNWPLRGLFMPDTIDSFELNGTTYIVSANEGDAREYLVKDVADEATCTAAGGFDFDDGECLHYLDEIRVKDIEDEGATINLPNLALFADSVDTLTEDENLGRIKIVANMGVSGCTTDTFATTGQPSAGCEYEALYTYGARSFSIWNGSTGELVFDSGSDFERITAQHLSEEFNATNDENGGDDRSDDKGPEPEAVEIATVEGKTYAFIGLERVGGIMVYDISVPESARFVQYINPRDFSVDIEELVDNGDFTAAGDLGPESIHFVAAEDSPNGEALLLVGNEVSGTTAVYTVKSILAAQ